MLAINLVMEEQLDMVRQSQVGYHAFEYVKASS